MSSVTRFLKQIPTDTPYFYPLGASLNLNVFYPDSPNPTLMYASGQAPGFFSTSTVTATVAGTSSTTLFRDMGVTIVSAGRTFRRIQRLTLNGGVVIPSANAQYTSAGIWTPNSTEGVMGNVANTGVDNGYNVFYFEAGWNGQGVAAGLVRYG